MNPVLADFLWALAVLLLLSSSMAAVKYMEKKRGLSAEVTRKAVHITMGVVVLPLPWLLTYKTTIVILGILATLGLLTLRFFLSENKDLGSVLYRVGRTHSVGELVFPAAVVSVFVTAPAKEYFVVPILVLTFSDSLAALIGTEYAKISLAQKKEAPKSFEGAAVFFFTAFFCVVSALLLLSDLDKPQILLASILIAAMSTLLELVCPFGLDNFFIPFLIAVFLRRVSSYELYQMVLSLVMLGGFILIAVMVRRYVNITTLGLVESVLAAFITILLGGYFWVMAPLIIFSTYSILPELLSLEKDIPLNYHNIECNVIPGLLIIVIGSIFSTRDLTFYTYFTYYACITAQNYYSRIFKYHWKPGKPLWPTSFLRSFLIQILPAAALCGIAYGFDLDWLFFLLPALAVLLSLMLIGTAVRRYPFPDMSLRLGWIFCSGSALLSPLAAACYYYLGGIS